MLGTVIGFPPIVSITKTPNPEKEKYEKIWKFDGYRAVAPGEQLANLFLHQVRPKPGTQIIDFGAGSGRGSLMLALLGRCPITMLDFASNCLDEDVQKALVTQSEVLRFYEHDLMDPVPMDLIAPLGYCTDVMEHIPTDKVQRVLSNIMSGAQRVFFGISLVDDVCGEWIGETLHLTVKPVSWWLEQFRELGATVLYSAEQKDYAVFYVTKWTKAEDIIANGSVNTDEETILSQIIANTTKYGHRQVHPHERQDTEILLLSGGPSLADFEDEIREKAAAGAKIITVNGVYNWCLEKGIRPSAQIIVDARDHNVRFVQPVIPDCVYLLASQCHPSLFEVVPEDKVWLWHGASFDNADVFYSEYYKGGGYFPIPGGSTVMLRAFPLLRMLGFYKFQVYGFDSCMRGDDNHAYPQPENFGEGWAPISEGDKVFRCTSWMLSQAHEFMDLMRMMGEDIDMEVHGDGLISHIIKRIASET